jgi:dTDP-4-dehydrorhamnose reductase
MSPPRIAVAGNSGQVARALALAATTRKIELLSRGRPDLDMGSVDSVGRFFRDARPAIVVNAAAYTAVDKAESEPDAAFRANAQGPALLATLCNHFQVPLIHISTDYVFDGAKRTPYVESDAIGPLGVYGASKAAGEAAVRAAATRHVIVRTAWVLSPDGTNFMKTMLRLGAEREAVRVVADQHGAPTSADDLAAAILDIAAQLAAQPARDVWGTFHLTNAGETTWHGVAAEVFRLAAARGLKTPRLEAITTADYPTPARRPGYSVLDNGRIARTFGIRLPPWQESLARTFGSLAGEHQGAAP